MALSPQRIQRGGETPHDHEREAIEHVLKQLPDRDPLHAWTLQELLDPSTGELLEIDMIVVGPHALYIIEIKSWPGGKLSGDAAAWEWDPGDGRPTRHYPAPFRLTNHKAKVLKGRLGREFRDIRVEALVFVSTKGLDCNGLTRDGRNHVVTKRGEIANAIVEADYAGAHPLARNRQINNKLARDLINRMLGIGLRAHRGGEKFGTWEVDELLTTEPGLQDYSAKSTVLPVDAEGATARLRVYRFPPRLDGTKERARLRELAQREFTRLYQLGDHKNILRIREFTENSKTHDPALVFERFDGAVTFDAFLTKNADLSFDDRLDVVTQIGNALAHCHNKKVIHRALCPNNVLARRDEHGALEVKLAGFQRSRGDNSQTLQTLHTEIGLGGEELPYRAPEMIGGSTEGSEEADVFSLAAFAYFVLTGRQPAATAEELEDRIREDQGLRPGFVQDGLIILDELFLEATSPYPVHRPTATEFRARLYDQVTRPDQELHLAAPREARKGQRLEGGLLVEEVLGQGASSRVLEVAEVGNADAADADTERYALKVPLDPRAEQALTQEANVLRRLRNTHIVACVRDLRLSNTTCLLLTLADRDTLADRLRNKGPLSLDLAHRFGVHLLLALDHLENQGVTHRDIKPANLGFTRSASKKAEELLLFDFSLSGMPDDTIRLGTVVYRDPWLSAGSRKSWDAAADRYSVAVTLHEMLTGDRPTYGDANPSVIPDAAIQLAPTRFDSSVRDALVRFFEKCLAPSLQDRFDSAEDMRSEWEAVFRGVSTQPTVTTTDEPSQEKLFELSHDLQSDTPIAAFLFAPLLLNALERVGAETAIAVARLPFNKISVVPGVGRETKEHLFQLVGALRDRFADLLRKDTPLYPEFALSPERLLQLTRDLLPDEQLVALSAAAIQTTRDLALASVSQIEEILHPFKVRATKVRRALIGYEQTATIGAKVPTTLAGWMRLFLQSGDVEAKENKTGGFRLRKKSIREAWAYLGLTLDQDEANVQLQLRPTDPLGYPRTADIARALETKQPNVSNAIGFARDKWDKLPQKPEFLQLVTAILDAHGGLAPLTVLADRLVRGLAADSEGVIAPADLRRAAALWRIGALLTESATGECALSLERVRRRGTDQTEPWFSRSTDDVHVADKLGRIADKLVGGGDPNTHRVPSLGDVRRDLTAAVHATALDGKSLEILAPLAARRSQFAAVSRKLELYPRGLATDQALNLALAAVQSAAAVTANSSGVTPVQVRDLVHQRYPEAQVLPDRPELDDLLASRGLIFRDKNQVYRLKDEVAPTIQSTLQVTSRRKTASTGHPRAGDEAALRARRFDSNLRFAVENGSFRALLCHLHNHDQVVAELEEFLGVAAVSLDQLFAEVLDSQMDEADSKKVKPSVFLDADRNGSLFGLDSASSPSATTATVDPKVQRGWNNVRKLAQRSQQAILQRVQALAAPRLLIHPGSLARYGLSTLLEGLRDLPQGKHRDALFLLVPHEEGAKPAINGTLAIETTSPVQILPIEDDWVKNAHNAGTND